MILLLESREIRTVEDGGGPPRYDFRASTHPISDLPGHPRNLPDTSGTSTWGTRRALWVSFSLRFCASGCFLGAPEAVGSRNEAFGVDFGAALARKAMIFEYFSPSHVLKFLWRFATYFQYSFGLKCLFFALCAENAHMHFDPQKPKDFDDFQSFLRRWPRRKEGKTNQTSMRQLAPPNKGNHPHL